MKPIILSLGIIFCISPQGCHFRPSNNGLEKISKNFRLIHDSIVSSWNCNDFCSLNDLADSLGNNLTQEGIIWCSKHEKLVTLLAIDFIDAILIKDSFLSYSPNIKKLDSNSSKVIVQRYIKYQENEKKYKIDPKRVEQNICLFQYQIQSVLEAVSDSNTYTCLGLDSLDLFFQLGFEDGCITIKKFYNPPMIKWQISTY